jgi:hypothetical protein
MKKFDFKRSIAFLLSAIMIFTMMPTLNMFVAAAEGNPVLTMSVANKIDVALAVGPTSVNYLTFEADLRHALKYNGDGTLRDRPVPDEDVNIMASKAVSANTTSEFSWWSYDHTSPAVTNYNRTGSAAVISNTLNMYKVPMKTVHRPCRDICCSCNTTHPASAPI